MYFTLFQPKTRRALWGWLVVAALAFHGLIPLGYMPDMSPKAEHPMQMTICNGMDMSSMDMDDEGDDNTSPVKDKADGKSSADHAPCPFSVNGVFTFASLVPDLAAPIFSFIAAVSFVSFLLTAQRRYENASPRAPPFAV